MCMMEDEDSFIQNEDFGEEMSGNEDVDDPRSPDGTLGEPNLQNEHVDAQGEGMSQRGEEGSQRCGETCDEQNGPKELSDSHKQKKSGVDSKHQRVPEKYCSQVQKRRKKGVHRWR